QLLAALTVLLPGFWLTTTRTAAGVSAGESPRESRWDGRVHLSPARKKRTASFKRLGSAAHPSWLAKGSFTSIRFVLFSHNGTNDPKRSRKPWTDHRRELAEEAPRRVIYEPA